MCKIIGLFITSYFMTTPLVLRYIMYDTGHEGASNFYQTMYINFDQKSWLENNMNNMIEDNTNSKQYDYQFDQNFTNFENYDLETIKFNQSDLIKTILPYKILTNKTNI